MPDSITTTIHAAVQRAMSGIMDGIATDGLVALKQTLDAAGVSERLKQVEIFSHISGKSVIFEIVVDPSVVVATDAKTAAAINEKSSKIQQDMMKQVTKSFEFGENGPRRVVRDARTFQSDARSGARDARSGARDARSGARDARSGASVDRVLENPHGMEMTNDGKLSVTLERSMTVGKSGVKIPEGDFQGILGDFMDRLNAAVSKNFSTELEKIITRHTT